MVVRSVLGSVLVLAAMTGCSDLALSGGVGVTPGGAQDLGYARDLIEAGVIPSREGFRAEGLFSEHDLPLDGGPCDATLCPQAASVAWTPVDGSGAVQMAQIGFGTRFATQAVQRPALELAVAVDVSGSMSGEPLQAVKAALHEVVDRLDEGDRFALVSFDSSARLEAGMAPVTARRRERLHRDIDALRTRGGTDIEAGLKKALAEIQPSEGRSERVLLLTDAQPNVGATDSESFSTLARDAAADGIGLTVFGVGLELGAELAQEMSVLRGGNYVYLADSDAVAEAFADFDDLVTPIAYDLRVRVDPQMDVALARAWGAPTDPAASDPTVAFGASTLFLSRKRGGMGASFRVPAELSGPFASLKMDWTEADGAAGSGALQLAPSEAPPVGVRKMAALADQILAMEAAADHCYPPEGAGTPETDLDEATAAPPVAADQIAAAAAHLQRIAQELNDDPGLLKEVALMEALGVLIEDTAACSANEDDYGY